MALVTLAAIGAILMNVSFHFANGAPHPGPISKEGFDEGVDLDSPMPFVEAVLVVTNLRILGILGAARNV